MVFEKTIREVVDENYVYARALHYLGIDFFVHPDLKLKEVCAEKGLEREQVIQSFYAFDSNPRLSFKQLKSYPIELLVEFLKHAHHLFIKDKLPYIVHLAKSLNGSSGMQALLPEFIEDLIRHIYEEEDQLFEHICELEKFVNGNFNPAIMQARINQFSVRLFIKGGFSCGIDVVLFHRSDDTAELRVAVLRGRGFDWRGWQ